LGKRGSAPQARFTVVVDAGVERVEAVKTLRTWEDCDTEEEVAALIKQKSQPDSRGRYHCVACGRFADPGTREGNSGEPRCEDHDFSYHGYNYAEYRDLKAFAENWL
jgi:hypothetical protein